MKIEIPFNKQSVRLFKLNDRLHKLFFRKKWLKGVIELKKKLNELIETAHKLTTSVFTGTTPEIVQLQYDKNNDEIAKILLEIKKIINDRM